MQFSYKSPLGKNAPKIRPIFAILFTTLFSALLIWQRDVKSIGTFRDLVMDNPGTSSFIKQMIAGVLGTLWIYATGSIFNLTTRLRLTDSK